MNNETKDYTYIKVINGRWTLNLKPFNEMTLRERQRLDEFVKQIA